VNNRECLLEKYEQVHSCKSCSPLSTPISKENVHQFTASALQCHMTLGPVDRLIGRASLPASRLWFRGQTAAAQQELRPTGVSNGAKFTAGNGCEGPQPREDRRQNSEDRIQNPELQTPNLEPRTSNPPARHQSSLSRPHGHCWPIPWRASAPSAPPVDRLIGRASLPASRLWFGGQTATAQPKSSPYRCVKRCQIYGRQRLRGPQPREDRRQNSVRSV
jgi:hypothetical protein